MLKMKMMALGFALFIAISDPAYSQELALEELGLRQSSIENSKAGSETLPVSPGAVPFSSYEQLMSPLTTTYAHGYYASGDGAKTHRFAIEDLSIDFLKEYHLRKESLNAPIAPDMRYDAARGSLSEDTPNR